MRNTRLPTVDSRVRRITSCKDDDDTNQRPPQSPCLWFYVSKLCVLCFTWMIQYVVT